MAEESRRGLHARYDAEVDAARNLAAASGWAFVDLERYSISCGILRRVPAETCCRLRAVPMVDSVHRRVMVVDDVFQGVYIETNPELLGAPYRYDVEIAFATRRGIDAALAKRLNVVK
jgi:hypothetical protein